MKIIKGFKKGFEFVVDALAAFGAVLIVLVMLCVTIDVIMRYFLNRPMFWVGELAEYALLFIAFTGGTWVLKNNSHVRVEILIEHVSPQKRRILDIITGMVGIFVCSVLTYYGTKVTWDHFARGVYNPSLLSFPKGPLLAVIPVGTFLLLIQFLRGTISSLRRDEKG